MEKEQEKEVKILDRVREFCFKTNISIAEFERRSGLSNGYFAALTKDEVGGRKLKGIIEAFPKLSISWLMTGEGPMLLEGGSVSAVNIGGDNNQNATAIVETIAHQLDEKDKQIDRLLGVIENLSNK